MRDWMFSSVVSAGRPANSGRSVSANVSAARSMGMV
jgi:hypothetical protein